MVDVAGFLLFFNLPLSLFVFGGPASAIHEGQQRVALPPVVYAASDVELGSGWTAMLSAFRLEAEHTD